MTFTQSLTTLGDRVLNKALGTVEAGACVPSNRQFCACINGNCGSRLEYIEFSCLGNCNVTPARCC